MILSIHHRIGKTLSIAFLSILLAVCTTRIVPRVWVYHHPHNPTLSTIASRSQGGESHEHRVSSPNHLCDRSRDRRDPPCTLCHVHSPSPCTPVHSNCQHPNPHHLPTSPSTTPYSIAHGVLSLSHVSQSMFHRFSHPQPAAPPLSPHSTPLLSSCAESSTSPRCGSDWRGSLLSHIPSHSSFCRDCSCSSQSDLWFSSSSGCTSTCAWKVTFSSWRTPFRLVVIPVSWLRC